jgi:restriction system protein
MSTSSSATWDPNIVPTYEHVMLPLLISARAGSTHRVVDALPFVADYFKLSPSAREETLPDGRNRLRHRLEWARTYLKKAGLLEYPMRGTFQITPRGLEVVAKNPPFIDSKFLSQFPEFREFKHPEKSQDPAETIIAETATGIDPEESIENSYLTLRSEVEVDLLEKIKAATPDFFEELVIDLLVTMGYGGSRKNAGRAIGKAGDGGIDGIIDEDSLGLDVIYIQAKRWTENPVGRPEIQKFVGALQGHRAKKGVFITTSIFSKDAHEYVKLIDNKVVLIDGRQLTRLMFDHNVGVSEKKTYQVKRVDSDYFEE